MKELLLTVLVSGLASGAIYTQEAEELTVPINKLAVWLMV